MEFGFLYGKAGSGDGGVVLGQVGAVTIAVVVVVEVLVNMSRHPPDAEYYARVLYQAIGIEEFGTDGTDVWPNGMADEFGEPFWGDDLGIVVEKNQNLAVGLAGGKIVDGGIIEGVVVGEHPDARIIGELCQVRLCVVFGGLVVDDQNFPIGVICFLLDAGDALR